MKAVAVFTADKSLQIVDIPEPAITQPGQVLVETLRVGVCGTDREIIEQGYGKPPEDSDFLVLGHECLGRVVEVGSEVSNFRPGQLVVPQVRRPCSSAACPACKMGRSDFCITGNFTERGINGLHGFLCERFVDQQRYFHAVPDELGMLGVLTEPLTIAEKALIQIQDVQDRLPYISKNSSEAGALENTTSVVLGAGPVALLGALALLNVGSKVYVYSRQLEPNPAATLVQAAGAEYVSSSLVDGEQLVEMAGQVDIIYEATGASQFAFDMTRLLGRNGIYVFTGVPGRKNPVSIDAARIMNDMVLKNQLLVGTVNAGPQAFEAAIHSLSSINRRWPGVLKQMITKELQPEEIEEAVHDEKADIKNVVKFQ